MRNSTSSYPDAIFVTVAGQYVQMRGNYLFKTEVSTSARLCVVNSLGVWWRKFGLADTNAKQLTSQHLTDLARGPVFYDCLVEVQLSAAPALQTV